MTIAWSSIVVLLLLLPGFLFFFCMYVPEGLSRDVAPRNIFLALAGTLLVSLLCHLVLYFIVELGSCLWGNVDLDYLIKLLNPNAKVFVPGTTTEINLSDVVTNFTSHAVRIILYFLFSIFGGGFSGYEIGKLLIKRKWFRFVTPHSWVLNLRETYSLVSVLTSTGDSGALVMYHGTLIEFYLDQDGQFSYLVLKDVEISQITISATGLPTKASRQLIRSYGLPSSNVSDPATEVSGYFYIRKDDIANVFFDSTFNVPSGKGTGELGTDWSDSNQAQIQAEALEQKLMSEVEAELDQEEQEQSFDKYEP